MGTRLYLIGTAEPTPIAPAFDAEWEDTSIAQRAMMLTDKRGKPMTTISFTDVNTADKDILFWQFIGNRFATGELILAGALITGCIRALETTSSNNMFLALGLRIFAVDGITVRTTLLNVTRTGSEAEASFISRAISLTSSLVDEYTTKAGDRPVLEVGLGGDPS